MHESKTRKNVRGRGGKECLTPREREIAMLMATGLTNKEIGAKLFVSEHTVKNHVSNIYRKLGIDDRTQLALWAVRSGLIELD
ncbi:MAG: response regulator transcription factor [Limnochordia bacterium]|jgi:DNA-binding NarL/FixJ family response regulator